MNEKREQFQGDGDFGKLVKKARRRSLLVFPLAALILLLVLRLAAGREKEV